MPKTPITPSPVALDLHALARIGAELQLQRLLDERARIVAAFPELREPPPSTRTYTRRAASVAPRDGERTCPQCGRDFTPDVHHQHNQKTCGRIACVKAYKSAYMRAYFAKRRAASNGAAS